MSSPVIPNKILGKFDFLNNVFTTNPQKENFWIQFFGITASDKTTINGFAEFFDGWKNQSSINRFISESDWSISKLMKGYDEFLTSVLPSKAYAIIDDSKKEKSGDATDAVFRLFDPNEKRYLNCHSFVVSALKFGNVLT